MERGSGGEERITMLCLKCLNHTSDPSMRMNAAYINYDGSVAVWYWCPACGHSDYQIMRPNNPSRFLHLLHILNPSLITEGTPQ
jgi:hypothetical protein